MLVRERKPLPDNWRRRMVPRPKQGLRFGEFAIDVASQEGREFRLIARQNHAGRLDFSIILLFIDSDGHEYVLRRNNGMHSSRHTNRWEKENNLPNATVEIGFHRHFATERYQVNGYDLEGYAEATYDYRDFTSAIDDLLEKCGFVKPARDNL